MRRACALGRNPRRRIAFITRARVSRLTCELEFRTREIVPTPTPAARATSRIVVFCGTASILLSALYAKQPQGRICQPRRESSTTANDLGGSKIDLAEYDWRFLVLYLIFRHEPPAGPCK